MDSGMGWYACPCKPPPACAYIQGALHPESLTEHYQRLCCSRVTHSWSQGDVSCKIHDTVFKCLGGGPNGEVFRELGEADFSNLLSFTNLIWQAEMLKFLKFVTLFLPPEFNITVLTDSVHWIPVNKWYSLLVSQLTCREIDNSILLSHILVFCNIHGATASQVHADTLDVEIHLSPSFIHSIELRGMKCEVGNE